MRLWNDDFNTPEAIGVLFELVREINRLRDTDIEQAQQLTALLKKLGGVLGIFEMSAEDFLREGGDDIDAEHVESLITKRKQAAWIKIGRWLMRSVMSLQRLMLLLKIRMA